MIVGAKCPSILQATVVHFLDARLKWMRAQLKLREQVETRWLRPWWISPICNFKLRLTFITAENQYYYHF